MIKSLFNRKLKKYQKIVDQINFLETDLKQLSDIELKEQTLKLRKQYQKEKSLKNIIAPSFALTRESASRNLNLRHFDVQLLGGLVLNDGKIAEMKTGEGKTLVATLPSYLNGLTGKGVHVVTVNDYLANRDYSWMGQIHRSLGLEVGLIQENMSTKLRQLNYNADVTYLTNSEVGFDYLRDNVTLDSNEIVQRRLNYCIIDEVDSILIDEAKTPLVLSDYAKSDINKYITAAQLVKYLDAQLDFEIDDKTNNIIITEVGIIKVQKLLQINNLFNPRNPWIPFIINALKANFLFFKDIAYIVKNGQVIIVDESTGRVMPDRRWTGGLHQAIEAKENLPIRGAGKTSGSITYQNFFSLYDKLSGMTGTAKTDETEFENLYKLSVIPIPTAQPSKRQDLNDRVFGAEFLKWKAVADECRKINETGQPILIGTTSVEKSEILSQLLSDLDLSHKILNAKPQNVKKESEIIATAGEEFSITIATNMAGRGTDIILGGNPSFKAKKEIFELLIKLQTSIDILEPDYFLNILDNGDLKIIKDCFETLKCDKNFLNLKPSNLLKILNKIEDSNITDSFLEITIKQVFIIIKNVLTKLQQIQNKNIKNLGGLYIIGTERHESRRIDNQLRGRCGRQGDPGTSQFFLSLDDPLIRKNIKNNVLDGIKNQLLDGKPLETKILTKSIDQAQQTVENSNYDTRKNAYDYESILNKQRISIFSQRQVLLKKRELTVTILSHGFAFINDMMKLYKIGGAELIEKIWRNIFNHDININEYLKQTKKGSVKLYLEQQLCISYALKTSDFKIRQPDLLKRVERITLLKYFDALWKEHLIIMSILRENVGWRGYGQRNPLFEYRVEGYEYYLLLFEKIRILVLSDIFHL